MQKLTINIFTYDLVWMGQIDSVKSLIHRTSWHDIPDSELVLSKTTQGIEELQIGRILVVNNQRDKALIINDLHVSLNNEYVTYNCVALKGMLDYRIAHPSDAGEFRAKKQAEIMMNIVSGNLITQTRDSDRKFWNSAGNKNMLRIAPLKTNLGNTIDYTVTWETGLMGEAITNIAKNAQNPLGWNIYITEDFTAFEMDVYQGIQKHIEQVIRNPVVFSEEFGNIKNAEYEYSIKQWRNVIYMTFTTKEKVGEETVETINNLPVYNTGNGATKSFNRKELVFNSSKVHWGEVATHGQTELNKRPHVESFTAEIINNENTMSTYKKDWNLGDVVTVQSAEVLPNKMVSLNAQITELEEIYDSGEYSINVTFNQRKLSLIQLIKNSIEQK